MKKLISCSVSIFLLCFSISMCAMIGQFSKSYFTVWPAKFKSLFEVNLPPLSECRDEINIWSVL